MYTPQNMRWIIHKFQSGSGVIKIVCQKRERANHRILAVGETDGETRFLQAFSVEKSKFPPRRRASGAGGLLWAP